MLDIFLRSKIKVRTCLPLLLARQRKTQHRSGFYFSKIRSSDIIMESTTNNTKFLGDLVAWSGPFRKDRMSGRQESCPDKSSSMFGSVTKNPTSLQSLFSENSSLQHNFRARNRRGNFGGRFDASQQHISEASVVRTSGRMSGQGSLSVLAYKKMSNIAPAQIF